MRETNHSLPDWKIQVISPGRVNLMGEHVDYNQGLVLPMAIDRSVHLAARPRKDGVVSVRALDLNQQVEFALVDLDLRIDKQGKPLPQWALYPAGVAWALRTAGLEISGLDVVLSSDVPIGAGLSSSAAVEIAFALAWQTAAQWKLERMQLAQFCQRAENSYVGINSGLMDQFACAHGVARHALFFDTRSLAWQPLPIPPGCTVVVADSGIRRQLSTSAYNLRRADCETAIRRLKEYLPRIQSLRDVTPAQLTDLEGHLSNEVCKRARHVVDEIERVSRACQCLIGDDAPGFGELMLASHNSLRDLYEVSLPQLDGLVQAAVEIEGCYGARLTGAGFGGCTVNLVNSDRTEDFIERLKNRYQQEFGREAVIYLCQSGRGAHLLGK